MCKVFRLLLHLSAKEKGHCLVWVPVLLFYDRIPDCSHLFNIPVSCFTQLLFPPEKDFWREHKSRPIST